MKVAIFIGHHKTGSTALQNYLCNSYLELIRNGILYPAIEAEGIAANLAAAVKGAGNTSADTRLNVREPHNALAFKLLNEINETPIPPWHPNLPSSFQMLHLIDHQIRALQPQQIILCAEVFSRMADRGWRKLLPRLQKRFGEHDTTIVLNLRRPDLYLASWHLQRLKFGGPVKPLRGEAITPYLDNVHFRFDRIIERWKETFPDSRLVARNYDDVLKSGGSVADFFAQASIAYKPVAEESRLNTGVPYAMAEIVRQGNLQVPDQARDVLTYVQEASERVKLPGNSEIEMFGAVNRQTMFDAFVPVHAAIHQMTGIANFFPDIDDMLTCRPIPELDAARAALGLLQADVRTAKVSGIVRDFVSGLVITD